MTLPTDSAERKNYPIFTGCVQYIPAALAGMARWSKLGNDKHNPGQPLHHARGKSADHPDCVMRHLIDLGAAIARYERVRVKPGSKLDREMVQAIMDECDALFWRAGVLSQELHEKYAGDELAPGAKL